MIDRSEETGSLGSDVVVLRSTDARVLRGAIEELSADFHKCWYYLPAGLAVFMATSRAHEFSAINASDLVKALCHVTRHPYVALGRTTAQTDDQSQGVDTDASFLIGERAARFRRMLRNEGSDPALADLGTQPQDLAIEVERAPYDDVRTEVYRAVGVRELWETPSGEPRILDLQAPGGVRPIEASRILPGVPVEGLPAVLDELRVLGDIGEFVSHVVRQGGWTPPWLKSE